jgi:exosortase/archaeosortase family protein
LQRGHVIEISTGVVGIDEACSGIRSFQATLMISLFLGELYALNARRRALCVLAGVALAFLFNIGRTGLLVAVASKDGIDAIARWHDPAGITILVGCFLGLWALGRWMQGGAKAEEGFPSPKSTIRNPKSGLLGSEVGGQGAEAARIEEAGPESGRGTSSWAGGLWVGRAAGALLVWLAVVEVGVEAWYRTHEGGTKRNLAWSVRWPETASGFTRMEIPPRAYASLRYDEGAAGRWSEPDGSQWQMFFLRWRPARTFYGRARITMGKAHGPEGCLPATGLKLQRRLGNTPVPLGETVLPLETYLFKADTRPVFVFFGRVEDVTLDARGRPLVEGRAGWLAAALAGRRNHAQNVIEVAITGHEDEQQARAAFLQRAHQLVRLESASTPPNHAGESQD